MGESARIVRIVLPEILTPEALTEGIVGLVFRAREDDYPHANVRRGKKKLTGK
jgi:hypothetical protein